MKQNGYYKLLYENTKEIVLLYFVSLMYDSDLIYIIPAIINSNVYSTIGYLTHFLH